MSGDNLEVIAGEVYVPNGNNTHALIIDSVNDDGSFVYLDTGVKNREGDFKPRKAPASFIRGYVKATPERLHEIIAVLDEERRIAQEKAHLLRKYCESVSQNDEKGAVLNCPYGNCSFEYPESMEGSNYRFTGCPNADIVDDNPFTIMCNASGTYCQQLHNF